MAHLDIPDYGFIMTRHVNSQTTNKYWNHSVKWLQYLYPHRQIVIIDDNSHPEFVKADREYANTHVIHSEFPGCGEWLPYYYFLKRRFFKNAVIIHDSVFFHQRIPFEKITLSTVLPLWYFHPDTENLQQSLTLARRLTNNHLLCQKLSEDNAICGMNMPQSKWYGCFGSQCYITHSFLKKINEKYNLCNALTPHIKTRADRCCLERILGCIFFVENTYLYKIKSLLGDIMKYQNWCEMTYDKYNQYFHQIKGKKPIIKVWSGR